MNNTIIHYKTIRIQNLDVFYREGGDTQQPTILFLHGFPSSSHMYSDLLLQLATRYHVVAPDYPGFGLSSRPAPEEFSYTFDNLAAVMEQFVDALGLTRFSLYMQDYGSPVGFRIASKRPQLIDSLLIQNANAYEAGLGEDAQVLKQLEKISENPELENVIDYLVSEEGIREQYTFGAANPETINPNVYLLDQFFMERPGVKTIQGLLLKDYHTNFPLYETWHAYLRTHQPPALILWGKNDKIFIAAGAQAYVHDLPDAELHLLDGGHFVLEEYPIAIANYIDSFLKRIFAIA